jgi:outer membrane receptor protein involved in Fe transport
MHYRVPFRLSPLAALLAGLSVLAAAPVQAADEQLLQQLQAEVARVNAENARLKKELESSRAPAAAPVAAQEAAPTSAAPARKEIVKDDEPVSLDAVVVRSRNRIERLQDVPLSVSVVTGKELDQLGANDIGAITKRAGNVSWNLGNQRTSSLSIRGIGKQGQTEAMDPSVGVIVDGVPYAYNALTSSFDFHDIDAVEVTRGPQGTLLGKNSTLGVINISTKRPSFTPSADYSLTFGEKNTFIGKLAAGGPIVDDLLAWRGTFNVQRADGDLSNVYNRDLSYTNKDRVSGRVQFLLTPNADFNARFALEIQPRAGEFTNGRTYNTPTPAKYADGSVNPLSTDAATRLARGWFTQQRDYTYANDYLSSTSVNVNGARPLVTGSHGASAELNWNLGNHTLTSITAYKDYHFNAVNDEGTPFDIARNSGGYWNDYKQVSQELRLSSQAGGFVDYQTGLFLMGTDTTADYQKRWGADAGAWFATTAQYNLLDTNAGVNRGSGLALLANSLNGLATSGSSTAGVQSIKNKSEAIFGQANWHLSEPLTLTTGIRLTKEDRKNTSNSIVTSNGLGGDLNPTSVNGVQLGGFASNATTGALTSTDAAQVALANSVAQKYFGVATYAGLTAAQQKQVATAKAIRLSQIGVLYNNVQAESFNTVQPNFVLSPSYKINDNLTTYVSWQYGEKAGISQVTNGVSQLAKAEKNTSYEWGVKSALLNKTLILNADVYLTDIKDYQQAVQVYDAYTTNLKNDGTTYYTSSTGNAPKVRATGLEVDGVYGGIPFTTIRFAGAYNNAVYKSFPNAGKPAELGNLAAPYVDFTGKTLPGAAKLTFNIGAEYRHPVWTDKEFHASFNTNYSSKFNSDNSLSDYAWVPAFSTTDIALGLGRRDKSYDVTLLVKNLFDDKTNQSQTWNNYNPAVPRWIGVMFTGKL